MMGPYTSVFVAVCAAVFFVKAAEHEKESPWIWGSLSVLASVVAMALGAEWLGLVLAQGVLYAGITVYRVVKDQKPE